MSARKPISIEHHGDAVTVTYYCAARHGRKYQLSFDRSNLDWITRSLETFTSVYGHPSVESAEQAAYSLLDELVQLRNGSQRR